MQRPSETNQITNKQFEMVQEKQALSLMSLPREVIYQVLTYLRVEDLLMVAVASGKLDDLVKRVFRRRNMVPHIKCLLVRYIKMNQNDWRTYLDIFKHLLQNPVKVERQTMLDFPRDKRNHLLWYTKDLLTHMEKLVLMRTGQMESELWSVRFTSNNSAVKTLSLKGGVFTGWTGLRAILARDALHDSLTLSYVRAADDTWLVYVYNIQATLANFEGCRAVALNDFPKNRLRQMLRDVITVRPQVTRIMTLNYNIRYVDCGFSSADLVWSLDNLPEFTNIAHELSPVIVTSTHVVIREPNTSRTTRLMVSSRYEEIDNIDQYPAMVEKTYLRDGKLYIDSLRPLFFDSVSYRKPLL